LGRKGTDFAIASHLNLLLPDSDQPARRKLQGAAEASGRKFVC